MALPIMIFSNSNNRRNINGGEVVRNGGFTITTTNRSLSLFPSLTNGGEEVMNGGGFTINATNRGLSLVPRFNGDEPVMMNNNGVFSNTSINHGGNRSLSFVPSFNGVSSSNHYNPRNRSLSLMIPGFNNGGETMINNGVSYNSMNDHQSLGFSVSSRNRSCFHGVSSHYSVSSTTINHRTRNLSFGQRFNTGAESVNNINGGIRRRTVLRNQYYSSTSSPLATSEMLRARLLSALSTRNRMHHHTPQFHPQNVISSQQERTPTLTITELDDEALAPSPLNVYYPPPPLQTNDRRNRTTPDDGGDDGGHGGDVETGDDGVTHSLPCNKYGPYTCPRCFRKFPTSQMFAAHVSSHYKHETRAQRRRRIMARLRTRNLRFKRSGEGITLVPEKRVAETKEEPVDVAEAEANGGGSSANVQVKEENADS